MILAVLVGLITVDGEFVFDDQLAIVENPVVNGEVAAMEAFSRDFWGSPLHEKASTYRPLTPLMWRALWSVFPSNSVAFHVLGLILHVVAVLFFLWTALQLGAPREAAFIGGIVFAVHAITSEAVGSNVGQSDMLCAILGLAYLGIRVRPGFGNSLLAAALLLLACLVKESAFVFGGAGLLFAGIEAWTARNWRTALGAAAPAILVLVAVIAFQLSLDRYIEIWECSLAYDTAGFQRLLFGLHLFGRGTSMVLLPMHLAPDHGYAAMDTSLPTVLPYAIAGGIALCSAVFLLWVVIRRRSPILAVAWVLMMGPLLLESSLVVRVPAELAERILYPAGMAVSAIVAAALVRFVPSPTRRNIIVAALAALMLWGHWQFQRPWRSSRSLWAHAVDQEPLSVRAHLGLSHVYFTQGQFPEAAVEMTAATYMVNAYPSPVDLSLILSFTGMPAHKAMAMAPGLFSADDPCRFVFGMLKVFREKQPVNEVSILSLWKRQYAQCFFASANATTPARTEP